MRWSALNICETSSLPLKTEGLNYAFETIAGLAGPKRKGIISLRADGSANCPGGGTEPPGSLRPQGVVDDHDRNRWNQLLMTITITHAKPADITALADIAEGMDCFYGATEVEPLDARLRQINEALFNDPPSAYALLAWHDGKLAGFASYSFLWPAVGLTRSLYLKELYIIEAERGHGTGKLLMRHLCKIAAEHRCSRVEWTTDQDNRDAQQFYANLGVPINASKPFYRIEGDDLRRAAKA